MNQYKLKMPSYQYRKSDCGDKTILRPSYLHNGISYTGETTSLYWIGAQDSLVCFPSEGRKWCKLLGQCRRISLMVSRYHNAPSPPPLNEIEGGLQVSPCPSVDRIVSTLYLLQYTLDPFHIYTPYRATSEDLALKQFSKFKNLKF